MTLMLEYVHSSQQKKNLSWTEGCDMQSKTDPGVTNRSLDKPSLLEQQDQLKDISAPSYAPAGLLTNCISRAEHKPNKQTNQVLNLQFKD
ncbi:hypothetical protein PCANC_24094 [Puccinia coronata f. sp. avenae]|uniref:Uncharacterized protein n=1 Tax=Puccinia coronata f. sp. avenae TaxID=200324 RepID=A0A2N5TM02_9BASI|nr:hypothetical protein PCANC_24094 [Puccinia coronata f. sp. avenae]PLW44727.1 hypothetical protein PCASD_05847 [Puccinia coronata f. sp. avenae]